MTLIEAVVVIFVIAWLTLLLLPALHAPYDKNYSVISCENNVKQVLLAEKIWAGDNNDKYPMEVSVTNGGAMELMNTPDAWKAFQIMSNELSTPKILYCRQDSLHVGYATNFDDNLKNKISYFVGLDATTANPAAFLSGDDNFLLNNSPANHNFVNVATNASLSWDTSRHAGNRIVKGNIGLGDGSVQTLNDSSLSNQLHQTGLTTNRFFIP